MTQRTKPSVLNLFGEILLSPLINQFAEFKLQRTPFVAKKTITKRMLTSLTFDSSRIMVPRKNPWPQKTKFDMIPKAVIQRKLVISVLISRIQKRQKIMIIGYSN